MFDERGKKPALELILRQVGFKVATDDMIGLEPMLLIIEGMSEINDTNLESVIRSLVEINNNSEAIGIKNRIKHTIERLEPKS